MGGFWIRGAKVPSFRGQPRSTWDAYGSVVPPTEVVDNLIRERDELAAELLRRDLLEAHLRLQTCWRCIRGDHLVDGEHEDMWDPRKPGIA